MCAHDCASSELYKQVTDATPDSPVVDYVQVFPPTHSVDTQLPSKILFKNVPSRLPRGGRALFFRRRA